MLHQRRFIVFLLVSLVSCGLAGPASGAAVAADVAADVCTSADASSASELSKLLFVSPLGFELNTAATPATACSPKAHPTAARNSSGKAAPSAAQDPKPVFQTKGATSSSQDLLKHLSIVVLVHNLMPRPLPVAWALATTAAAWLYLTFDRLQPWLPQTRPPCSAGSTAMAGSNAVAAAAGLSPAATAGAAAGGVGGDPSTRWWQHALLFLELFWGNAVAAVLMMGLLLLPVVVLRRWLAGRRLWNSMSGLSTASSRASTAAEPAGDSAQDDGFLPNAARAARTSLEGIGAQLLSAGDTAARLAKAMKQFRSSSRSSTDSQHSSTDSGSSGAPSPWPSSSEHISPASSSSSCMVQPEQPVAKPMTPPLLYAARRDGPLGKSAFASRVPLARPLQPSSPVQQGNARHVAAAVAAGTPAALHPPAFGGPSTPTSSSSSNTVAPSTGSNARVTPSDSSTNRVTPGDSSSQQHSHAEAPAGSLSSGGGSNAGGRVSLNLGAVGTIRTLAAREQPLEPSRVLYSSPLETVVISCKLAARGSTVHMQGTGPQRAGNTSGTGGVGVGVGGGAVPAGYQVSSFSPVFGRYGAEGHSDRVSAQRELRAVVEGAVRQAVAASNVAVLSTSVTSFPGCVHVVTTTDLTADTLAALAAPAETATTATAAGEAGEVAAAPAGQLADKIVWEQIVQQLMGSDQPSAHSAASGTSSSDTTSSEGAADALARNGLFLKHLLVQDRAGNIRYLWVSPDSAPAGPASAAASSTPLESESVQSEPVSPSASSTSTISTTSRPSMRGNTSREREGLGVGQLLSAALGITLSSFALPTDAEGSATAVGAASKLLLPEGLAAALAAARAGLRVVVSGNPDTLHAAPSAGSDDSSDGFEHVVADHTLWPGTSSWPAGAEFDLQQLLPANTAALVQRCGPVLTVNITATIQQSAGVHEQPLQSAAVHEQHPQPARAASAGEVYQNVAQLVRRLNAHASGGSGSDAPASALAAHAATVPALQQGNSSEQMAAGEHVLLQVPLLLLPSAACLELSQLQQSMQADLVDNADAATAARMHMLLFIRDVAAMFSMGANSFAAPPAAEEQQQPQQRTSTLPKFQLKRVLQYMSDQSCDTLAAAVSSYLGVDDTRQLLQHEQHSTSAQQVRHSQEIEPAGNSSSGEPGPSTVGAAGAATTQAAGSVQQVAQAPSTSPAAAGTSASAPAPAAEGMPEHRVTSSSSKQAAKALAQASAAHEQASAAQRAAAATESALQLALAQIAALSSAAADASRQAADAQAAAASATQRAAAVEEQAERQRALQLISSPAGAPAGGTRGVGIWGLLGGNARAVTAARAAGSALLGGVMRAAEPPLVPAEVAPRDVLLGFEDERLEVQYRRMKALQCRSVDRAAFLMQLFRHVVYVWRIARLMYASSGTGLSLVLLCKYEAVVLLPYVMMTLTPDFYIYHRHLLLCLSQIAAALTVGMIATTEVYRNEWFALLQHPGPTLLARPSMMMLWYYLLVPILQQQTLPEQALSCVAQLVHSLLIYMFILKGTASLMLVVPLLLAASAVSFVVAYVADAWTRQQAVAGARRSLGGHTD